MMSDTLLLIFMPIAAYWLASAAFHLALNKDCHRLFSKEEEDSRNLVSKEQVLTIVIINQLIQMTLAAILFGGAGGAMHGNPTSILQKLGQMTIALLVIDAWEYWWHRLIHESKFLFKHVHEMHHRLTVPYAYGTLYAHPVDHLIGQIAGAYLSFVVSGMSSRTAAWFYTILTVKSVDDHACHWLPFHRFLPNNVAHHALHHQYEGFKYNFSIYFLNVWDRLLGTYLPFSVVHREGGGYEICTAKSL